jgi:hypothetical protein
MEMRRCQPSETREVLEWIEERHYLRSTPPGFRVILEFTERHTGRVGAMQWGRPTSRELDPAKVLELTRMYFDDKMPKNTESHALSMARRHIRVWMPEVRLLLAYSDPGQGHAGTVYEADGWAPFGRTAKSHGCGWKSREGRRSEQVGSKTRWVRTP